MAQNKAIERFQFLFHNCGMQYGYARVSSVDQNPDMQLKALQRAGCQKVFKDEASGATAKRPGLMRCIKSLRNGDRLTVWRLDRLARSLRDLVAMIEDFNKRGIQFRSLTEEINTTTPGGKLVFHIFAALADNAARAIMRSHTAFRAEWLACYC
jgi:DNA invertase Pin-like site-specific DNA recombinase